MKKLFLFIFLSAIVQIAFTQKSHLQIIAEPGIKIFLNGNFKDITSSDLGGLIISNLTPGTYKIKAVKENFQPQEETIILKAGEVKEYKVKPFTPSISISETGTSETQTLSLKTGKLKIQSLPIAIDISIPLLGVTRKKTQDEWLAKEIPEGVYNTKFEWNGKTIEEEIEIVENELTHIFVDMINEKIEYRKRAGSTGSLKINSKPNGHIEVNGIDYRQTPFYQENMRIGLYNASLTIELNSLEYLDNRINLSEDFHIEKNKLTVIEIDLFDKYKFGRLKVSSSNSRTEFSLYNK